MTSAALFAGGLISINAAENLSDGLYAEMETSKGTILLELTYQKTPLTVANFVGLAEGTKDSNQPKGEPFYDGLIFHRVIPDFMIQGGDPEGSGRGGPGYKFPDETRRDLTHSGPGILSMANSDPQGSKQPYSNTGRSNGSQFFITHKATPWLDGFHTVFGKVVEGQDVVDAIKQGDKIESVDIIRVGEDAKAFQADQAAFDKLLANHSQWQASLQADAEKAKAENLEKLMAKLKEEHPDKELVTTDSGLKYIVLEEGSGPTPKRGQQIKAHYKGQFVDGRVFDNSEERGPIAFAVGTGRVIPGWDEALMDMQAGEKRILVIPPDLAYGPRGRGPIPPNATLVFEVELVEIP